MERGEGRGREGGESRFERNGSKKKGLNEGQRMEAKGREYKKKTMENKNKREVKDGERNILEGKGDKGEVVTEEGERSGN